MDPKLIAILKRNQIVDPVIQGMLGLGCKTVEDLANWVEKREDLERFFITPIDVAKDDAAQKSRLKMAWRQADAICERALKRQAEGLTEECWDEPLDPEVVTGINEAFKKAYTWRLFPPERVGTDTLVGRVYREFQAFKPTVYSVAKVKTLAISQSKPLAAKRRMGNGVTITMDNEDDDEDSGCLSLLHYLMAMEVLGNTWVLCGQHQVTFENELVRFVYWPDVTDYMCKLRTEGCALLLENTESSVITYMTTVEEGFRTKAVELTRGDERVPWGKALLRAMKDKESTWDHLLSMLTKKRIPTLTPGPSVGATQDRSRRDIGGGNSKKRKVKAELKESEYRRTWVTAKWHGSLKMCKKWNDPRGCRNPCADGCSHTCDVVLSNGNTCGSKSHNRYSHTVADHGMPKKGRA